MSEGLTQMTLLFYVNCHGMPVKKKISQIVTMARKMNSCLSKQQSCDTNPSSLRQNSNLHLKPLLDISYDGAKWLEHLLSDHETLGSNLNMVTSQDCVFF